MANPDLRATLCDEYPGGEGESTALGTLIPAARGLTRKHALRKRQRNACASLADAQTSHPHAPQSHSQGVGSPLTSAKGTEKGGWVANAMAFSICVGLTGLAVASTTACSMLSAPPADYTALQPHLSCQVFLIGLVKRGAVNPLAMSHYQPQLHHDW